MSKPRPGRKAPAKPTLPAPPTPQQLGSMFDALHAAIKAKPLSHAICLEITNALIYVRERLDSDQKGRGSPIKWETWIAATVRGGTDGQARRHR